MKDWYAEKWNRSQTGSEYLPVEYVSVDELMKDHLADPERRAWTRESESLETQKLNEEVDAQALKLDGLVSPNRKEFDSPVDASDYFRKYSKGLGVDLVGISVLRKEFVYSGYSVPHKYAISLGMRMDPTVLKKVPYSSNHECMKIYRDLGAATVRLAEHIREMGYPARAHHPGAGNGTTQVEHLPVAWSAGLGELGRHGSLINPTLGSWFRLGTVTTDLELETDSPMSGEVTSFCKHCNMCARHCPGDAISSGPMEIANGTIRWLVDTEKCIPYFIELRSCAICIQVCPWNAKALDQILKTEYVKDSRRFKGMSGETYRDLSFETSSQKYL